MTRPIALSCGEPAGIGAEIAAKAWAQLGGSVPFVWLGDPRHLAPYGPVTEISDPAQAVGASALPVLPMDFGPAAPVPGQPNPAHAPHVIASIEQGVDLVQSGACAALCTAPIHKQALIDGAGFGFPGHTEFLAHLAGVRDVVMMLACPELRVVPATIHIPLSQVPDTLTQEHLDRVLHITYNALQDVLKVDNPRIAVAGLNPHAGEGGKMGHEDSTVIAPVLDRLRAKGMQITGPHPADTMFHASARARYDVAVAMYHDQALIPIKTIDFAGGVNVTLGLPFIRTSPDHGTAFDIAGQGKADPTSLIAALRMAAQVAP